MTLRLTTDASLTAIDEERAFVLDRELTLLLGPDEPLADEVGDTGRRFVEQTAAYWRDWVRHLAIPFEWQDAVIRAAVTLKQNAFDDTGAIVAAMTTSIPEAAGSARNWDYRYCWLRDAYFVVDALNRLNATGDDGALPRLHREHRQQRRRRRAAAGVPDQRRRGAGRADRHQPAGLSRHGPGARRQRRATGRCSTTSTARRSWRRPTCSSTSGWPSSGDEALFERLEVARPARGRGVRPARRRAVGTARTAARCTRSPASCAGPPATAWRASPRGCGLADRAAAWRADADRIARFIHERCWSEKRGSFVATVDGDTLDASLLLLADLRLPRARRIRASPARSRAIERDLKRGDFVFRYVDSDDFGVPENAFVVCTFWYVNALAALGRRDEARERFERLLGCRNRHGLLAEHLDPATGEAWGNFVQTYSMVGLITSAIRLSVPWSQAI